MAILREIQSWATVAFGIGFVIFIHELGHFLLAKWNGVKVLKFSVGFGPALVSYRRGLGLRLGSSAKDYAELLRAEKEGRQTRDLSQVGETEYALRALPLGGAVHMLGEGPDEGEKTDDPRAYANRPVFARMAIISAGVIMNLLLGWACFTWVFLRGTEELSARIAAVIPGRPAYMAGLRPGDTIVAIDGRKDVSFNDLRRAVALSGSGQALTFDIRRPGQEELIRKQIRPDRPPGEDLPTIGIAPADDLTLADPPFQRLPGMPESAKPDFQVGDRVVGLGPAGGTVEPVATPEDYARLAMTYRDRPIAVRVERGGSKPKDGEAKATKATKADVTVPVTHWLDLGVTMEPGPITAIRPGSSAATAGLEVGDRIIKVDGDDYDPMLLPYDLFDRAGSDVTLEVARGEGAEVKTRNVTVRPAAEPAMMLPTLGGSETVDVAPIGLATEVRSRVAAVRPGSPAARAGVKAGDLVRAVTFTTPAKSGGDSESSAGEPTQTTVTLDGVEGSWARAMRLLQFVPAGKVSLTIQGSETPIGMEAEPRDDRAFYHRGLVFAPLLEPIPPQGLLAALQRGGQRTVETATDVYSTIRNLIQRRVSKDAVGGPIMIFSVAYKSASVGLEAFIPFLAILSVNLAVINFLPIFPLDGGQMLFLIAEKVRGKPLPERVHVPLMLAGLVFVLLLILLVSVNDVRGLIFKSR